MSQFSEWQAIATFSDLPSAELARGRLEAAGISSQIDHRGSVGIFGAGFSGTTGRGFALLVHGSDVEASRVALDLPEKRAT